MFLKLCKAHVAGEEFIIYFTEYKVAAFYTT